MNYLQKKKLAFMSIVNQVKGFVRTIISALPLTLEGCVDENSIIDYKIYGQSVQDGEPTPDNPIEVESVGEKTKNLINWDYLLDDTGITKTDKGYYSEVYYHSFGATSNLVKQLKSVLKPDTTYTLSRICDKTKNGATIGSIIIGVNGASFVSTGYWEGLKSTTFTITQEQIDNITSVIVYFNSDGEGATISEVQLTESDTVLPYEPYGKYKIPVTVSGRNLFDEVEASNVNNWTITSTVGDQAVYNLYLPSGIYTFTNTYIGLPTNSNYSIQIRSAEGTLLRYVCTQAQVVSDSVVTRTLSDGEHLRINLYVPGGNGARNLIPRLFTECISKVLIYEGTYTSTDIPDYESYHEPITTNIYLDEPLRKVGDYADYIDFESGKVVRNVKKAMLERVYGIYTWLNKKGVTFSNALDKSYNHLQGLSNRNIVWTANGGELITIWLGVNSKTIYWIGILDYLGFTTIDEMNEWLINNPTYVLYGTDLPTEQPISLPTIPTFKGASIVSTDTTIQPSNAEIEYYSNAKE